MRTATVGEIQKNFSKILHEIRAGEEITITRHGQPIARLTALGPKDKIEWPEFFSEAIPSRGKAISDTLIEEREDRF
ncbi:MAG: type II toxin-antitoxin system Phd/YefM family antitoxin [Thermodesulfobacteriota bacterium]